MFGLTRNSIWKDFALAIGGNFYEGQAWHSDRVEIQCQSWKIIFDNYISYSEVGKRSFEAHYTRIRVPFQSPDRFQFTLSRKGILSSIGKLFGAQDIVIGDQDFDRQFIIKGTDELKVRQLFSNSRLRDLISKQADIHIEIVDCEGYFGDKLPDGHYELFFMADGNLQDFQQLEQLKTMMEEFIHQLSQMGVLK